MNPIRRENLLIHRDSRIKSVALPWQNVVVIPMHTFKVSIKTYTLFLEFLLIEAAAVHVPVWLVHGYYSIIPKMPPQGVDEGHKLKKYVLMCICSIVPTHVIAANPDNDTTGSIRDKQRQILPQKNIVLLTAAPKDFPTFPVKSNIGL